MFKLGNLIVDHIAQAVISEKKADGLRGDVLYTITQLNTATVEVTSDSKDTVDKYGNLVKRIYNAKAASFSATNAMLDVNVIGGQAGDGSKTIADTSIANSSFEAPKIVILPIAKAAEFDLSDLVEGHITVTGLDVNNAVVQKFELGTAAAATTFAVSDNKFVPPTTPDANVKRFMLVYDRTVKKGLKIVNSAKDFPKTVDLLLKAMAFDPCDPGNLRGLYIEFPSFQPSPEVSFELTSDATFDYSGDAQVDYCGDEKAMYILTWADEDEAPDSINE